MVSHWFSKCGYEYNSIDLLFFLVQSDPNIMFGLYLIILIIIDDAFSSR